VQGGLKSGEEERGRQERERLGAWGGGKGKGQGRKQGKKEKGRGHEGERENSRGWETGRARRVRWRISLPRFLALGSFPQWTPTLTLPPSGNLNPCTVCALLVPSTSLVSILRATSDSIERGTWEPWRVRWAWGRRECEEGDERRE
jgi:hypothetical protein